MQNSKGRSFNLWQNLPSEMLKFPSPETIWMRHCSKMCIFSFIFSSLISVWQSIQVNVHILVDLLLKNCACVLGLNWIMLMLFEKQLSKSFFLVFLIPWTLALFSSSGFVNTWVQQKSQKWALYQNSLHSQALTSNCLSSLVILFSLSVSPPSFWNNMGSFHSLPLMFQ